jgi:hypothetical protein
LNHVSNLNFIQKGTLFLIFHSISMQSLVNFRAIERWFSQFTNWVQFEKIENHFLAGRPVNNAAQVQTGLAPVLKIPTEAHRSTTPAQGTRRAPRSSRSGEPSAGCRRWVGLGYPPLSSAYKKEETGQSYLFPSLFPHHQGEDTPLLTTDLLRHWAIPRAQLISTPLHFFCPRYWHHRPAPSSSTTDHAGDFHRRR